MWCTNHNVEFATELYARWKTAGGMSSMRTAEPPGDPSSPRRPCVSRTAARSASLSAAQTHRTSSWSATEDSPETRPPAPRRAVSRPSALSVNDTGPRLEAMRTRPPAEPVPMAGRLSGRPEPGLQCSGQLHTAHPEGWRDRPCEAPATITVNDVLAPLWRGLP